MPLLQVRNFPDDLYEQLALLAHEESRSITQETVSLLKLAIGTIIPKSKTRNSAYTQEPFVSEDEIIARNKERRRRALEATAALNLHLPEGAKTPEEMIREDRDR